MSGELIFSATNTQSRRSVLVINEGDSVWAYLSTPASMSPATDCWLMNLVDAPTDLSRYRDSQLVPPATSRVTSQPGALTVPDSEQVAASWSGDGEAAAVLIRGRVMAFLTAEQSRGFSRFLIVDSQYGQPFDTALFTSLFGHDHD